MTIFMSKHLITIMLGLVGLKFRIKYTIVNFLDVI